MYPVIFIRLSNVYPNVFLFIHYYPFLLVPVVAGTGVFFLSVNIMSASFILTTLISLIFVSMWFRDFLREYQKRIQLLSSYVVAIFVIFVAEESMLFLSFFWASYHHCLSPMYNFLEGLFVYDALTTWTNTLILSNAALALSGIIYNYYINGPISYIYGFILGSLFLSLQLREYRGLGTNVNDQWSVFYIITGLHCFHVIVGLCILPVYFQSVFIQRLSGDEAGSHFYLTSYDVEGNTNQEYNYNVVWRPTTYLQLILVYWHLVELLWIFIFLSNYL